MNPLRALFLSLSRMPPAVMLLIIVGLAVVVTMMVTGKMGQEKAEYDSKMKALEAQQAQKAKVVYSVKDIPEGATVSADALEEKEIEAGKVPPDAFSSSSMAVGRVAKYGIPAGQIVSAHDFTTAGHTAGFEDLIKDGHRAVTFGVDTTTGVAGFVAPGSHVDVVAIVGSAGETKAAPILSDVEIIAVGQTYQKSAAGAAVPASTVTVGLTPEDANKLIKSVSAAGKIYLTLRNDKDHTPVAVVDVSSMYPKPKQDTVAAAPPPILPPPPLPGAPSGDAAPAPPPPPPMQEIEVWSGSKKEVISVPKS
jgi:pilus assembly protein CpaB